MSTQYGPPELLSDLVEMLEQRWIGVDAMLTMYEKINLEGIEHKIAFFRELRHMVSLIPIEIFSDDEQRQNMINAAQEALDRSIEEEEEWLDGLD